MDPDSLSPTRRWIAATVAALPAAERERATTLLAEQVALQSGEGPPADLTAATERMERSAADFPRRWRNGRWWPCAVVLLTAWLALLTPTAIRSARSIDRAIDIVQRSVAAYGADPAPPSFPLLHRESVEDSLAGYGGDRLHPAACRLLTGNLQPRNDPAHWQRIWLADAQDPVAYYAYACAFYEQNGSWPPDLVATGDRLEPGNGWYRAVHAVALLRTAVAARVEPPAGETQWWRVPYRRGHLPPGSRARGPRPVEVTDFLTLYQGLAELRQALAMPAWDSYHRRRSSMLLALLPPSQEMDLAGYHLQRVLRWYQPDYLFTPAEDFIALRSVLQAWTEVAYRNGGAAELRAAEALTQDFLAYPIDSARPMLEHSAILTAGRLLPTLATAWDQAGDPGRSADFAALAGTLEVAQKSSQATRPADGLSEGRGTFLQLQRKHRPRPPGADPVGEGELRADRLAEYAMHERLLLYHATTLLVLAALLTWVLGALGRRRFGKLPARLGDALTPRDRWWIAGCGVLLPCTVYLLASRLAWPRSFALEGLRFSAWMVQLLAVLLAIPVLTRVTLRHRLSRHATPLQPGWQNSRRSLWLAGWLLATPFLEILLCRALQPGGALVWLLRDVELPYQIGLILPLPLLPPLFSLLPPLFSLLRRAPRRLIPPPRSRLQQATLAHLSLPLLASACAAAGLAGPLLRWEERHWTDQRPFEFTNSRLNPRDFLDRERDEWEQAQVQQLLAAWPAPGPAGAQGRR